MFDECPRTTHHRLSARQHARVNSDRAENIQRRHELFAGKMWEILQPKMKDPQRLYGTLEREIIYYRDHKKCAVCGADVIWPEAEIHHVDPHSQGGRTSLQNGALVHKHCHPMGQTAMERFAKEWRQRRAAVKAPVPSVEEIALAAEADDNGDV